ncbi:UDP-N-acetylglucosamine 2-epimerase [Xanthomarina gelatinilytica]|uniref:UDP-N-acetylglucosamine 2-epimerase n=1 Tax=Xanthomarina gelatinilytica TaxID=1137281 RepID=UPI003AA8F2FD
MKIGVLTSSRADYGIYKQLLSKLSKDDRFELVIIVFGMHLLKEHGNTFKVIEKDNFGVIHKVSGMPNKDSEMEIAKGYGNLIINFSEYWSKNNFDCVLALGDRFEMSAAVQAAIAFNLKIAHLHGGETTLGAIDNIYRHQITLVSKIHFVSSDIFANRVSDLIESKENIYNVGSLSIDGLEDLRLPKWSSVMKEFNIPAQNFILVTFHSETVDVNKNRNYCNVIYETLEEICQSIHVVITMANADTNGSLYRETSKKLKHNNFDKISLVESFGKENYFSAMKESKLLIGNTSSGIIEAASFGKFVINVGKRQLGRLQSGNVFNVDYNKNKIIKAFRQIIGNPEFIGANKYYKKNTVNKIIEILANERL